MPIRRTKHIKTTRATINFTTISVITTIDDSNHKQDYNDDDYDEDAAASAAARDEHDNHDNDADNDQDEEEEEKYKNDDDNEDGNTVGDNDDDMINLLVIMVPMELISMPYDVDIHIT